jgi:capsule polysaccharide export protein KpsE/RkpR
MSETRKTKKKKRKPLFSINFDFFKVVRLVFLIFLAVCLVYLYYLHTKGILVSTMDILWKKHQKTVEMSVGITAYTLFVYYLGYQKGKKR